MLKCLQFPKGRSELKLDLPLRMEHIWAKFGEGEQTVAGNTYANYPCANTVYFSNFNMQVRLWRSPSLPPFPLNQWHAPGAI